VSVVDSAATAPTADQLQHLITRIAAYDRAAFADLYDATSDRLRDQLQARLGDPAWAGRVLVATYVEVWWLARRHCDPGAGVVAWINGIAERRVAEGPPVPPALDAATVNLGDLRARHAETELAALLGRPVVRPGCRPDR
jgi:hypothetical protein